MKLFFTIWILSICMIATSGQQNVQIKQIELLDRIQRTTDSVAIEAANQIDSLLLPGKVYIRIDDYPLPYGTVKRHYWYYWIKRGDTSYFHFK